MNRTMLPTFTVGLRAVCFTGLFAVACGSSAQTACDALVSCCQNVDDPSSCIETAQSGTLTTAQCESELQGYVATGQCYADGGVPTLDGGLE